MTKNSFGYEAETNNHGKVCINDIQFFGNVTLKAWDFYISSYQPAQKWIKYRHVRNLSNEDVSHFKKNNFCLNQN